MRSVSNRAIYTIKCKKRNYGCRYSEFHITHSTIFSLVIITLMLRFLSKPKENNQNKKKRKRNIIWFNPPNSKCVKTNIRRIFIKLISKHFPRNRKFVKIFNKNTIKLSYSCMPNTRSKINGDNKKNTATQTCRATEIMKLPS